MRGTIHLVTADDALVLRPLVQPVLDAELTRHRDYAPALVGVDLRPVLKFARRHFEEHGPQTGPQLRAALPGAVPGRRSRPRSRTRAATTSRSSRSRPAACGARPRRSR